MFFFEEPVFESEPAHLRQSICPATGVRVITPVLPHGLSSEEAVKSQSALLKQLLSEQRIEEYIAWYYTPMALRFSSDLKPALTVYDCMDELSAFQGAPAEMRRSEQALFQTADLVFTGGASLFESKKMQHSSIHLFPSSVDRGHFAKARTIQTEPADQQAIPQPRLGYAGVIDERMDLELIRILAASRPGWHVVMLGPVVKIDPATLPKADNIHYLGIKAYGDLPGYLSGWDVALLPFALNESTKFISPTKTPEYLAAGLPVVSTPIRDVVKPYGEAGIVEIAATPASYVAAVERVLTSARTARFIDKVDPFLVGNSWDKTWRDMEQLIGDGLRASRVSAVTHFSTSMKEDRPNV